MLCPKLYFMRYITLSSFQYSDVVTLHAVAGFSSPPNVRRLLRRVGVMASLPNPIRPFNLVLTPLVLLVSPRRNRNSAVGVGLHLKRRSGEEK
jgi:hypothetical protein